MGDSVERVPVDGPAKQAYISGVTFPPRPVFYAPAAGLAIFEGDIVLGTVQEFEDQAAYLDGLDDNTVIGQSTVIAGQRYRWPNGVVPYDIHGDLPDAERVVEAIRHWQERTAIRFVERSPDNASQLPHWVTFQPADGCAAAVGMQGGNQVVHLGDHCHLGKVMHEIGHVIGLWHEQSREDRDDFVVIHTDNIDPDQAFNFDQHIADGDDVGPYDYRSIMHYPRDAFSWNGEPTIEPVDPGVEIGQRTGLSDGDVAAVATIYTPTPRV